jgi:hypothetical protein
MPVKIRAYGHERKFGKSHNWNCSTTDEWKDLLGKAEFPLRDISRLSKQPKPQEAGKTTSHIYISSYIAQGSTVFATHSPSVCRLIVVVMMLSLVTPMGWAESRFTW